MLTVVSLFVYELLFYFLFDIYFTVLFIYTVTWICDNEFIFLIYDNIKNINSLSQYIIPTFPFSLMGT